MSLLHTHITEFLKALKNLLNQRRQDIQNQYLDDEIGIHDYKDDSFKHEPNIFLKILTTIIFIMILKFIWHNYIREPYTASLPTYPDTFNEHSFPDKKNPLLNKLRNE